MLLKPVTFMLSNKNKTDIQHDNGIMNKWKLKYNNYQTYETNNTEPNKKKQGKSNKPTTNNQELTNNKS